MDGLNTEKKEFVPTWEGVAAPFFFDCIIGSVFENILVSRCKLENSVKDYDKFASELPKIGEYITRDSDKLSDCKEIVGIAIPDSQKSEAINKLIDQWFEKAKNEWFAKGEKIHKKDFEEFLVKMIKENRDEYLSIFDLTEEDYANHHDMITEFVRDKFRKTTNPKYSKEVEDEKSRVFKEKIIKYLDAEYTKSTIILSEAQEGAFATCHAMVKIASDLAELAEVEITKNDRHPVDVSSDLAIMHEVAISRFKIKFDPEDREGYFGKFIIANKEHHQTVEQIEAMQDKVFELFEFLPARSKEISEEFRDNVHTNCYSSDANFFEMIEYLFTETIPAVSAVVPEFVMKHTSDVFSKMIEEESDSIVDADGEPIKREVQNDFLDKSAEEE